MTQAEVNLDYEVNNLESQLSATQEIKQETTLFAEPVFNLKNFPQFHFKPLF